MTRELEIEDYWPSATIDWRAEVNRAVAWACVNKDVPADAAPMLAEETLAALQRLLERLLAGVPELEPMPAHRADLAEWMQRNGDAVQARKRALWGHWTMRGEVPERGPVPLDEALAEELGRLRDATAASAVRKSSTELAGNPLIRPATFQRAPMAVSKGEESAWRTHHRTLHGLVHSPSGESWPPHDGGLAMWYDGPGLWLEGGLPWYDADTRAKVAELWEVAKKAVVEEEQRAEAQRETPVSWQRVWVRFAPAVRQAPWFVDGWVPPVRLLSLALALWGRGGVKAEWERRERARKSAGPVPAIHPVTRKIVAGASMGALVTTKTGAVDLEDADGGLVRGWIQPAAAVSLPEGRLAMGPASDLPLPGLLSAVLARMVWEAAVRGDSDPRIVTLGASKHELERALGVRCTEDELDSAIDALRSVAVAGGIDAKGRVRSDWFLVEKASTEKRVAPGGGRPALVRVIHCGWPLAPWALKGRYRELGVDLPSEFRFVSGVLDPAGVPLVGDRRTRHRQRQAMSLGFPAWMQRHREEYAERGGVRLEAQDRMDWENYAKNEWGLYVRQSHASLPATLLEAAVVGTLGRGGVAMPVLPGMPGAPVLVETERGSGRYRMADDGQHALLLEAGGKTVAQRGRRLRGLERERKRVEKAQRPSRRKV